MSQKKWFSILGLLAAIIISLFIGLTFNLSILEGAETMEPEGEKITGEEVTADMTSPSEDMISPDEEEITDMTLADISEQTPSIEKKRGEGINNYLMNNGTTESFSLIRNF